MHRTHGPSPNNPHQSKDRPLVRAIVLPSRLCLFNRLFAMAVDRSDLRQEISPRLQQQVFPMSHPNSFLPSTQSDSSPSQSQARDRAISCRVSPVHRSRAAHSSLFDGTLQSHIDARDAGLPTHHTQLCQPQPSRHLPAGTKRTYSVKRSDTNGPLSPDAPYKQRRHSLQPGLQGAGISSALSPERQTANGCAFPCSTDRRTRCTAGRSLRKVDYSPSCTRTLRRHYSLSMRPILICIICLHPLRTACHCSNRLKTDILTWISSMEIA